MDKGLLAVLNDQERLLVAQTHRANLDALDEDEVIALHARVRAARTKYTGQYRRAASARVAAKGGRGKARPENQRNAQKAEAFEEALSLVSRRLAVLSRRAADELRKERLAASRAGRASAPATAAAPAAARKAAGPKAAPAEPRGDRALRSPRTEKNRAATTAAGARRQAKRDSR